MAPIHSSISGFTGFFTNTGISTPCKASAISCMANGLAEVRAPIQRISIPCFKASSMCFAVATSVPTNIPVSALTRCSHGKPSTPTPSKPPGLVRGFQIPARKIGTPFLDSSTAVAITCSSVSALQGPAIIKGRSALMPGSQIGCKSFILLMFLSLTLFAPTNRQTD